jgi:hypothetical protein
LTGSAFAVDATTPPAAAPHGARDAHHAAPLPYPHPVAPEPAVWPGVMLVVIAGMFFAAAVIGPIVRASMEEELPPTHSHDEDHGHEASHVHGQGHAQDAHDHH